jgi:hypothetical protein
LGTVRPSDFRKVVANDVSATSACKLLDFLPRDRSLSNTDPPNASSAKFRVYDLKIPPKSGHGTQPGASSENSAK